MKEIIKIDVKTRTADFSKCKTDVLAVGHFSDDKGPQGPAGQLNKKLDGAIERSMKLGDFKGTLGTSAVVYGNGKIGAKRVLLVGLGEKKNPPVELGAKYLAPRFTWGSLDTLRKAAANAAKKAVEMKAETLALALHQSFEKQFDSVTMGRALAEGTYLGGYRYDEYVTGNGNGRLKRLKAEVIDSTPAKTKKVAKGLADGVIIGRAHNYARTLANRPANLIHPAELAAAAKELAGSNKKLSCTIFDEKQMKEKGMGGVLAVGSGSQNKPRFIILKYKPAGQAARKLPTVALVGKAITFDSGGLSIKPADRMDEMKLDKTGGIAVMAAMKAAAELQLPLNVLGLIPSAENLPSGSSYRPGDIVTTFSGKTVEVLNTDAEGRMILCDALAFATRQKCNIIIDVATLTGACMVALGKYKAGLFGNDENLIKQLQKAAEQSGEAVWPMPSGDEYAEEMKSKIADLKNTGSKWGGACTAAAFLRQFVGDSKWAHLDIAGVDIFSKPTEFNAEGSTGFGVRLLVTYLMNLANSG